MLRSSCPPLQRRRKKSGCMLVFVRGNHERTYRKGRIADATRIACSLPYPSAHCFVTCGTDVVLL